MLIASVIWQLERHQVSKLRLSSDSLRYRESRRRKISVQEDNNIMKVAVVKAE